MASVNASDSAIKNIVLIGAGHAHVEVLRAFGMQPLSGVQLTLITREASTLYSGMLPGLVAGHYAFDQAHIDTRALARFAGAILHRAEVISIDLARKLVVCADGESVPFDILSIDIGSTPNTSAVPGAAEHAIAVKPIDGFLDRFDALRTRVLAQDGRAKIALVGGGAGGVELLLSVAQRLRQDVASAGHGSAGLSFVLVTGKAGLLPDFPDAFRQRITKLLAAHGITIHTGMRVSAVEPGQLRLIDSTLITADEILWVTEASAASWLQNTNLALDERGFLRVDTMLRCHGQSTIFAAGDIAAFEQPPIPKSGLYAVRAGPVLAHNIRALVNDTGLKPYKPQRAAMYLVSTGDKYAIGTRNGVTFSGRWVWRLKDWIDRRFIRRFKNLPRSQ